MLFRRKEIFQLGQAHSRCAENLWFNLWHNSISYFLIRRKTFCISSTWLTLTYRLGYHLIYSIGFYQTIGLCVVAHSAGGPGEWNLVEMMGQGTGIIPWKFPSISSMFAPWKSLIFSLFGAPPSLVGLILSILAPKWAAPTMNLCTEHCAWVSYLRIPHQNSTSKCPSVACEV